MKQDGDSSFSPEKILKNIPHFYILQLQATSTFYQVFLLFQQLMDYQNCSHRFLIYHCIWIRNELCKYFFSCQYPTFCYIRFCIICIVSDLFLIVFNCQMAYGVTVHLQKVILVQHLLRNDLWTLVNAFPLIHIWHYCGQRSLTECLIILFFYSTAYASKKIHLCIVLKFSAPQISDSC